LFQATSVAAQIAGGVNRQVGVTLTPAGQGRFEIYLDGELLYNRKEPNADTLKDPIGDVRNGVSVAEMVRTKLLAKLEQINAQQPAPAGGGH
jgi:predicted Rdx family selenoprotein